MATIDKDQYDKCNFCNKAKNDVTKTYCWR